MFRRLSSQTSRDSDAREEDCALGRMCRFGIRRGWCGLWETSNIGIKWSNILVDAGRDRGKAVARGKVNTVIVVVEATVDEARNQC